ncbi:hypothetical protein AMTRI_Chr04g248640 [Amborella trichopoda]
MLGGCLERERKAEQEKKMEGGAQERENCPETKSMESSPAHEFEFTISLRSQRSKSSKKTTSNISGANSPPSPQDIAPADRIFYRGHILPLQLIENRPLSLSNNAIVDDRDSLENSNPINWDQKSYSEYEDSRPKSRAFSLFGGMGRKKFREREEAQKKKKKKVGFSVREKIERYVKMVRPLFGKGERKSVYDERESCRSSYSYSFSGNLTMGCGGERRGEKKGGEVSAPASLRTTPTNSGLLFPSSNGKVPMNSCSYSSQDSTMEEIQSAIQAAIAHCKNSISMKENRHGISAP